jgi:hypothetical protein
MKTMNRREMLVATGTGGVALATVGLGEGCNANAWISTVLADLPTILQIITSILGIVGSVAAVPASVLAKVNQWGADAKAALQAAQNVITAYQTAQSTAKPGMLAEIDSALSAALANLSSILSAFQISDTTLEGVIAAALGSAITAVLAIEALVPSPPVPAPKKVRLMVAQKAQNGSAVMREAYNLIVGQAYPNAVVR